MVEQLPGLIRTNDLSAAVYTRTTDIEIEVNGLMTYDHAVLKMNPVAIIDANKKVYAPSAQPSPPR